MGNAVDCGRERAECAFDMVEKVERRLLMYELARSSLALDGGDVTSGGNDVRFIFGESVPSLLGDSMSAAMAECLCRPRTNLPSPISSSLRALGGVSVSVMREDVVYRCQ
jgi:hypothetical protein